MKNRKKQIIASLILIIMLTVFIPFNSFKSLAANSYTLTFTIDTNATNNHKFEEVGGHLKIDDQFLDPREATNYTVNVSGNTATITITDGTETTLNINTADKFTLFVGTNEVGNTTKFTQDTTIEIRDYTNNQSSNPPVQLEDIEFDIEFTTSKGLVIVNNKNILDEGLKLNSVVQGIGTTDVAKTNEIKILNAFGDPEFEEITINGIVYTKTSQGVVIDPTDGGFIIEVPGAAKYTIRATGTGNAQVTIIWANVDANKNATNYTPDMLLEHGTGKIIEILDPLDNKISGEVDVDSDGMGWVPVTPGNKVVFEFVPEYGYQLTKVLANGVELKPQDTINQYIFTMPNTNVHFSAEFTKIDDVVNIDSKKVSQGEIVLEGELDGGTAKLVVEDIDLDSTKISNFEKEVGEYNIQSYLNIDLYNIYYKGKLDTNDVWSNQIKDLKEEAEIVLQLEEGVNGNEVVIVHEKDDGTFEVIPCEYNASTNTIKFKTKSFSNYAIASRTVVKNSVKTPTTGDYITTYVALFAITAFTISALFIKRKIVK